MARATSTAGAIDDALVADLTRSETSLWRFLAGALDLATKLERAAATNVKRVVAAPFAEPDWTEPPTPRRMLSFVETKTVWHPVGI